MMGLRQSMATDEGGFTLVELLVAMSIMLVAGVIVVNGIVSGLQASERGRQRVLALTDLERAAARMARDLRFADPLESAAADQVVVTVLRDDGGLLRRHYVTYDVDTANGTIDETRVIYASATSSTVTGTVGPREVIGDLVTPATVFAFAKADGSTWDPASDPESVLAEVRLDLSRDLPDQDPIKVQTAVFVRNVDDGR